MREDTYGPDQHTKEMNSEPPDLEFNRDNYTEKHGRAAFILLDDCPYCNGQGWRKDPTWGGTMNCTDCNCSGKQEPEDW